MKKLFTIALCVTSAISMAAIPDINGREGGTYVWLYSACNGLLPEDQRQGIYEGRTNHCRNTMNTLTNALLDCAKAQDGYSYSYNKKENCLAGLRELSHLRNRVELDNPKDAMLIDHLDAIDKHYKNNNVHGITDWTIIRRKLGF